MPEAFFRSAQDGDYKKGNGRYRGAGTALFLLAIAGSFQELLFDES